jgi:hypothetical protein
MQFETGKFITLMETEDYASHVVVNKNKLFKTHVYLEHYNHLQEEQFNRRIEEFTIKYDYVFDSVNSNEKTILLVNSKNNDYYNNNHYYTIKITTTTRVSQHDHNKGIIIIINNDKYNHNNNNR